MTNKVAQYLCVTLKCAIELRMARHGAVEVSIQVQVLQVDVVRRSCAVMQASQVVQPLLFLLGRRADATAVACGERRVLNDGDLVVPLVVVGSIAYALQSI